jgi:hypothetical protein
MKVSTGGVSGLLGFLDTLQQGKAQRQQQQQQFSQERLQSEQRMSEGRRADATYKRGVDAENRAIEQYNRETADYNANKPIRDLTRATQLFDLKAKLPKERLQLKTQWKEFEGKQKEALKPLIAKLTDRNLTPGNEAIIRGQIDDIVKSVKDAKQVYTEHATTMNFGDIFSDSKWEAPDLLTLGGLTPNGQQQGSPTGQSQNVGMDNADIYNWMDMQAAPQAPGANVVSPTQNNVQVGQGANVGGGIRTNVSGAGMGGGAGTNVVNTGMGGGMDTGMNAGNVTQNLPPPPPNEQAPPTGEIKPPAKPEPVKIQSVSTADILAGKPYNIAKDTSLTAEDKKALRTLMKERGVNDYEIGAYDYTPAKYDPQGGSYTRPDGKVVKVGALTPATINFNPIKATRLALPMIVNAIKDFAATNKVTPYDAQIALGLDSPDIQLFDQSGANRLATFLDDNDKSSNLVRSIYNRAPDLFTASEDSRKRAATTAADSMKGAEAFMEGVRDDIKREFDKDQGALDRASRKVVSRNEGDREVMKVVNDGISLGRANALRRQGKFENWAKDLLTGTEDVKTTILRQTGFLDGKLPVGLTSSELAQAYNEVAKAIGQAYKEKNAYKYKGTLDSLQTLETKVNEISEYSSNKIRSSTYYKNAAPVIKQVLDSIIESGE